MKESIKIPKERYKKHSNYRYDMRCEMCGDITTYIGLDKTTPYLRWLQILLYPMSENGKDPTIQYEHCETCKLMTRQILVSFDLEEQK